MRGAAAVSIALALGLAPAACSEPTPGPAVNGGDARATPTSLKVRSRDGVIATTFPVDVVVHEFERAIAGTSADGGFRLFIEHYPADKLIRLAGGTKDALVARGWEVTAERHYETAIEVVTGKGRGKSHITRVTWFVARAGRVLVCEGIARDAQQDRLGEPLRRRCEQVDVAPLEDPGAARE